MRNHGPSPQKNACIGTPHSHPHMRFHGYPASDTELLGNNPLRTGEGQRAAVKDTHAVACLPSLSLSSPTSQPCDVGCLSFSSVSLFPCVGNREHHNSLRLLGGGSESMEVTCLGHKKHCISICEGQTFLQNQTPGVDDVQPSGLSGHRCSGRRLISTVAGLTSPRFLTVPRAWPPPLGELFPEVGIIVKPCWCPFSSSLTALDPWGEMTPQLLAVQVGAGGRGSSLLRGRAWVPVRVSPHRCIRQTGPILRVRTPRLREDGGLAQGCPTPGKGRSQAYSPGVLDDSGPGCPCWGVCWGLW